jgi:membrane protein
MTTTRIIGVKCNKFKWNSLVSLILPYIDAKSARPVLESRMYYTQSFCVHCSMLTTRKHNDASRDTSACTEQMDQRTPSHIPLHGWWDMLQRSSWRMSEDRLLGEAAAVAFYSLLAVLPALAALISLFSLVTDPQVAAERLKTLTAPLPAGAAEMAREVLEQVAVHTGGRLGLGIGLAATALWSAMAAASQLFGALNVIYREQEGRGFIHRTFLALLFAWGATVFIALALGGIVVTPMIGSFWQGLDSSGGQLLRLLRWPALLAGVSVALALIYRLGPSRASPQWRWVSWGATVAAIAWLIGSVVVSWYFEHIANYGWLYGSLGTVLGFMIWAWVSSAAVLFGAALNAEIEQWKWPI